MTDQTCMACGTDPRAQLTDGDRQAVTEFHTYLASRVALLDRIAEALYRDQTPPPTLPWAEEQPLDREYFLRRAEAVIAVLPEAGDTELIAVLAEVETERARQDSRWGEQNHCDGTGPDEQILPGWPALELATAARTACELQAQMGIVTWRDIFGEEVCEALAESDPVKLRAELVQAVAVGVAWIQAIDRRTHTQDHASTEPASGGEDAS